MARRHAVAIVVCACSSPLDPNAPAWTRVDAPGPSPRWGHAAVYDAAGDRMLVFGGETAHGETDELWAFELASATWARLATNAGPAPRVNPGAILDEARGRLVVFAGRTGALGAFGDAWALDLATLAWTELPAGPPPRQRPHVATDGTRAWLYGGEGFARAFGDLWELDLATNAWTQLPNAGDGPGGRTCGAIAVSGGALALVGGHDAFAAQSGAFRYDVTARAWSRIATTGGTAAGAHWAFALDVACDRIYLATGDHDDNYDTSLVDALDLGTGAYARVPASALPAPRDHASLVVDARRRQLVLFGGGVNDGEGFFGDTWIYPLPACP